MIEIDIGIFIFIVFLVFYSFLNDVKKCLNPLRIKLF